MDYCAPSQISNSAGLGEGSIRISSKFQVMLVLMRTTALGEPQKHRVGS